MNKSPQQKILRGRKQFYRCPYHGQKCGLTEEMRNVEFTRAQEKIEIQKEIDEEVFEFYNTRCTCGRIDASPELHHYNCPVYEEFDYEYFEDCIIGLFCELCLDKEEE